MDSTCRKLAQGPRHSADMHPIDKLQETHLSNYFAHSFICYWKEELATRPRIAAPAPASYLVRVDDVLLVDGACVFRLHASQLQDIPHIRACRHLSLWRQKRNS